MKLSRILVRSLVALLGLAVVFIAIVGWIGSERALRPAYGHYDQKLSDFPDLKPQPFIVRSETGIDLYGDFFPGTNHAMVVLVSGYGDTEDLMLPYAEFLHRAGFNTLVYNPRARGKSGGDFVTLGALEQIDLRSVVHWAASQPGVDRRRVGALGVSLGGSTVILTAANDQEIRSVVDDCGFADAESEIAASFVHFIHLPAMPFAPVTIWIASHRAGLDINKVRPVDVIGRISPRPILIIHGLADFVVPVDNSKRNFKAAHEPKQLWLVPGAKHASAHKIAGGEYEDRVVKFFDRTLD
jgi:fermentation-respiration switch protein FrsA (DUF1100 family)